MDRRFVRTAAVVFCAAWAAGCGSTAPDKPTAPTSATGQSSSDLPSTLDGEIARAHSLRLEGRYDDAGKALAQLMLVAPDDVRVVGEYGKVLAQQGRPGEALPFLARAVQMQTNDWTLYSALGVAYDQADQHAKAHAAYEHALALKPGQPDVLNNYAVSRMLSGDLAGAQRLLAEAKRPGSGDAKIDNNMALLATMKPAPKPAQVASHPASNAPAAPGAATAQNGATGAPKTLQGPAALKTTADATASDPHKLAETGKPTPLRHQDGQPAGQQPILRTAADGQ